MVALLLRQERPLLLREVVLAFAHVVSLPCPLSWLAAAHAGGGQVRVRSCSVGRGGAVGVYGTERDRTDPGR
jgi:4-amino-4-deoxy-L-arabinose transferase-like glycosyltransferase